MVQAPFYSAIDICSSEQSWPHLTRKEYDVCVCGGAAAGWGGLLAGDGGEESENQEEF